MAAAAIIRRQHVLTSQLAACLPNDAQETLCEQGPLTQVHHAGMLACWHAANQKYLIFHIRNQRLYPLLQGPLVVR